MGALTRVLKDYQQRTLSVLNEFLGEITKVGSISLAFSNITKKYLDEPLVYNNQDEYIDSNIAHVCMRVPTGGGKTLIAANAINVITENINKPKNNLVVWFVPSTAILNQTIKALKDDASIYREHLGSYFDNIEILSVSESLNISKSTLDNNLTIIVATFQSFRVEDPEGRKAYSSSGDLMEHFSNLNSKQNEKLLKLENGCVSYSLCNVININRPIVIIDEAHNARTDLSFEFLKNINPSFILELTATPDSKQYPLNVLYSVSAAELKSEKMLKIPMYVFTKVDWKELLGDAISKRVELEVCSSKEEGYVRPIMLIQAQPYRKEKKDVLNVEKVLKTLLEDFKIPRDQIAIQISNHKELDDLDLLSESCSIRYIITVSALKEGWDCPYAYVLCSLAELSSSVAVEQIVGRIIRQPYTKHFSNNQLNRSYAYVYSNNFINTLNNLRDAFVNNGFDKLELEKIIKKGRTRNTQLEVELEEEIPIIDDIFTEEGEVTLKFDEKALQSLNTTLEDIKQKLVSGICESSKNKDYESYGVQQQNFDPSSLKPEVVPEMLDFNDPVINKKSEIKRIDKEKNEVNPLSNKIHFEKNSMKIKKPLTDEETDLLLSEIESDEIKTLMKRAINCINDLSPSERGEIFSVPLLTYKHENLVTLGEENQYTVFDYDYMDRQWDIKKYNNQILKTTFTFTSSNLDTGLVDISNEGFTTTETLKFEETSSDLFVESAEDWTEEELILWLDNNIINKDIPRSDSVVFITQVIAHLKEQNNFSIIKLVKNKYKIKEIIIKLISVCRDLAREENYQLFLDEEEFKVDETNTFTYDPNDYPYNRLYKPGHNFKKHYYKQIGDMTSKGEEYNCAIFIDNLEEVEYWVRNIPIRKKKSYWLQTSTDKFYPDFVCKLKDGRILVVEYKGEDRWSDDDSKEKRLLGNIWAKNSDGKALFIMPKGKDLEQIRELILKGM